MSPFVAVSCPKHTLISRHQFVSKVNLRALLAVISCNYLEPGMGNAGAGPTVIACLSLPPAMMPMVVISFP